MTKELRFYKQNGCAACEEAAPVLRAWAADRLRFVIIIEKNLSLMDWKRKDKKRVRVTPTYELIEQGESIGVHEGPLNDDELTLFLADPDRFSATIGVGVKPGSQSKYGEDDEDEADDDEIDDGDHDINEGEDD